MLHGTSKECLILENLTFLVFEKIGFNSVWVYKIVTGRLTEIGLTREIFMVKIDP